MSSSVSSSRAETKGTTVHKSMMVEPQPRNQHNLVRAEPANPKKKRQILDFLTLKEPSAQAFAEMEERMKRLGTTEGGRVNPVGIGGNSAAKLPASAPNVHSRWDGIPKAIKAQKEKAKSQKIRGSGESMHSSSSGNSRNEIGGRRSSIMTSSSTSSQIGPGTPTSFTNFPLEDEHSATRPYPRPERIDSPNEAEPRVTVVNNSGTICVSKIAQTEPPSVAPGSALDNSEDNAFAGTHSSSAQQALRTPASSRQHNVPVDPSGPSARLSSPEQRNSALPMSSRIDDQPSRANRVILPWEFQEFAPAEKVLSESATSACSPRKGRGQFSLFARNKKQ